MWTRIVWLSQKTRRSWMVSYEDKNFQTVVHIKSIANIIKDQDLLKRIILHQVLMAFKTITCEGALITTSICQLITIKGNCKALWIHIKPKIQIKGLDNLKLLVLGEAWISYQNTILINHLKTRLHSRLITLRKLEENVTFLKWLIHL